MTAAPQPPPDPSRIIGFPDDPKLKLFYSNGILYAGYRLRRRDPVSHRQHEHKVYLARVVDGRYVPLRSAELTLTPPPEPAAARPARRRTADAAAGRFAAELRRLSELMEDV